MKHRDPLMEVGTVLFEGRAFEALGAVVTDDRIACYPCGPESKGSTGVVRTFTGDSIGHYVVTGNWLSPGFGGTRTRMIAYRIRLHDGRWYSARGQGSNMLACGRRGVRES